MVNYEVKPEDLNTELTNPEIKYLFKSGQIKHLWLEQDGLPSSASLQVLHDINKTHNKSYDHGVIDKNIMDYLTKSCKESEDRINQCIASFLI